MAIKFGKFSVSNGAHKARVFYSRGGLVSGRDCVTLYAKDTVNDLARIFCDLYINRSDAREDYFEDGLVRIYPDSPFFEMACLRAV